MFGSVLAFRARLAAVSVVLLALRPWSVAGSGGLMDDERLLYSQGLWHRMQRKRVSFESACYYTHEVELPYGCQYAFSKETDPTLPPFDNGPIQATGAVPNWRTNSVRTAERDALMEFYEAAGGKWGQWAHTGWRTIDNWGYGDPCWDAWYGIGCDEHGFVISIDLVDNKLEGTVADGVGALTSLLKFDISTSAADYHNHENKNRNRMYGTLPSLSQISRIEEINIAGNEFVGLPDDLYLNGQSLRVICGSYNFIRALPKYMNRFVALHTMELDHNQIAGTLPPDIGFMPKARYIHLDTNLLRGPMPTTIAQLTRIRTFDVSHNTGLTDVISEDVIVNWAEVEYLAILNTSISGYISSLCLDVPFCWKYMFDTHKDLTWATAADVPDIVNLTIELAKTNPDGPPWGGR